MGGRRRKRGKRRRRRRGRRRRRMTRGRAGTNSERHLDRGIAVWKGTINIIISSPKRI